MSSSLSQASHWSCVIAGVVFACLKPICTATLTLLFLAQMKNVQIRWRGGAGSEVLVDVLSVRVVQKRVVVPNFHWMSGLTNLQLDIMWLIGKTCTCGYSIRTRVGSLRAADHLPAPTGSPIHR